MRPSSFTTHVDTQLALRELGEIFIRAAFGDRWNVKSSALQLGKQLSQSIQLLTGEIAICGIIAS